MNIAVEERWSTREACDATTTTERQLTHWVRRGYLFPEGAGQGSGYGLRWSVDDLMHASVLAGFLDGSKGHSVPCLAGRLAILRLDGDFLTLQPFVAVRTVEEIVSLLSTHPLVTVLPLAAIRAQLLSALPATG